jgi:membrane-bound ClpP family serine protease
MFAQSLQFLHFSFLILHSFLFVCVKIRLLELLAYPTWGMTNSQLVFAIVLFSGLVVVVLLIIVAASRHQKAATKELNLMGAVASVEMTLEPEGSVLIGGELWRARSLAGTTIERGRRVRVVSASGHLLEVEMIH